jgi:hypothetical protein
LAQTYETGPKRKNYKNRKFLMGEENVEGKFLKGSKKVHRKVFLVA